MQIDWFTVVAQIVNFLILLLLLRKFLYGPVVNAMNDREEKIKKTEQEAQNKKKQAENKKQEYESMHRELENSKKYSLSSTRKEVEDKVWEITEHAGKRYIEKEKEWKESFEREKTSYIKELKEQIGRSVCSAAQKALKELAGVRLEEMVFNTFVERFKNSIDGGKLKTVKQMLKDNSGVVEVCSAFKLNENKKDRIRQVLDLGKGGKQQYRFSKCSELICGMEIRLPEYRISWNVKDFINSIESRIIKKESVNAQGSD